MMHSTSPLTCWMELEQRYQLRAGTLWEASGRRLRSAGKPPRTAYPTFQQYNFRNAHGATTATEVFQDSSRRHNEKRNGRNPHGAQESCQEQNANF